LQEIITHIRQISPGETPIALDGPAVVIVGISSFLRWMLSETIRLFIAAKAVSIHMRLGVEQGSIMVLKLAGQGISLPAERFFGTDPALPTPDTLWLPQNIEKYPL